MMDGDKVSETISGGSDLLLALKCVSGNENQKRGQACDFAILPVHEFSRLPLAGDITNNSKPRAFRVCFE